MKFIQLYLNSLPAIMGLMTMLWVVSIRLKNVSIVDNFWGVGFVVAGGVYFLSAVEFSLRGIIVLCLAAAWGLRLSIYLSWRNWGKGEDYRYREFRKNYGEQRYWWFSFFQVFLLQGILMWLVSSTLLGAQYDSTNHPFNILDLLGILVWVTGFAFETIGDIQLVRFRNDPANKGKLLTTGLWKYTRHPNYFGDAAVWTSFSIFSIANHQYLPVAGSALMIFLIVRVSGVSMTERALIRTKPGYREYMERTSPFIPWFPKTKK